MSSPAVPVDARVGLRALRLLPGVAAAVIGVGILLRTGTPAGSIALYMAGFVWQVVLPGIVLYRALAGQSRQLGVELGVGSGVGLMFQLVGWLVFVGLGIGHWIVLWPLVVLVPFAVLPRLRHHLRPQRYPELMHPLAAWGLAGCFALFSLWFTALFNRATLPPAANLWYQDQYYHLSLSGMFLHQVVPMTPQVAGRPLIYHWFSNAHMAGMALSTGQQMPLVLTRLWILPIVAVTLFLFVAVMHELTGAAWPAVVAAALTTLGGSIRTAGWYSLPGTEPFAINSPSQNYSLPFLLFALLLIARLLRRGEFGRGEWGLLAVVLLMAPGTKSSSLLLLICGLALALLVSLLQREGRRAALLGLGMAVVALAITTPVLAGGSAGAGVQLFSTIRKNGVWDAFVGLTYAQQQFPTGSHILPGLAHPGAPLLLGLLVLAYGVQYLWLLPGALVLTRRHGSAGWFLLGVGIAGWAAMMLIDHDGMSQVYFMNQALLAWDVLAAWGLWLLVTRVRPHLGAKVVWGVALCFALLGWGSVRLLQRYGPTRPRTSQYLSTMAVPLLVVVTAVVVGVAASWLLWRAGRRAAAAAVSLALAAGLLGAGSLPLLRGHLKVTHQVKLGSEQVTAGETQAALWLRDHAPARQIVATNVHCVSVSQAPHCDARAFWVSGFSEHPVLIEGWGYTDQAHLANGRGGYRYSNQPFDDPLLYDLNQKAFTEPSASVMEQLAGRGVRWLFADTHRGPVSSSIGAYADEVWRTSDVVVYRLR